MAAKAVTHRCRFQPVAVRADQVVLAIANHQRLFWIEPLFGDHMGDQLDLVGAGAVQLAAIDQLEVVVEGEMPRDFAGENRGFRRRYIERPALSAQVFEHLQHAVEQQVFVQPDRFEALAVMADCFPCPRLIEAIELHERL